MLEKLTYIEIGNKKYPIKCDLNVLESIQDQYGSLSFFERELSGFRVVGKDENEKKIYEKVEPSMKAVKIAFNLMLNEGLEIENQLYEKGNRVPLSEEETGSLAFDINIFFLANELHREYIRCFESKNQKSTWKAKKNR